MKNIIIPLLLICFCFVAFIGTEDLLFQVPPGWPQPAYDLSKNPLSPERVELGRALFYDPILSGNNSISCSSWHSPFTSFAHVDHALSHVIDNRIGNRNAPAIMNLA